MSNIKCAKCEHEMNWTRLAPLQARTYYCLNCGYSFRRTIFHGVVHDPIYAIGTFDHDSIIVLTDKTSFDAYSKSQKRFSFKPLKNSTYDKNRIHRTRKASSSTKT